MKKKLWVLPLALLCALLALLPVQASSQLDFFEPVYTARVTRQSSLRSIESKDGRLVATLYRNDKVEIAEIGAEWTMARKDGKAGYILTESLADLEVLSPYYRSLPYGSVLFPYAATALESTMIVGTVYGQLGELQTVPEGAIVAAGEPDHNGDMLLPFMRTVGQISGEYMQLERVVPAGEAQPGDLIAVYSTFFSGDVERSLIAGRLHNIEKGVALLDGVLIGEGERFSFNDIAAPYSKDNGYLMGPIINYTSDVKTGYGGGVCQVSTTLYNALLQLRLHIVRWQPHSSRGIEYAPVGFDAAVGNGNQDFIFDNDLPYGIRMRLNVWDGVVTVRLYRDAGA